MKAFTVIRFSLKFSSSPVGVFPNTRTQHRFPEKLFFCRANSADSGADEPYRSVRVVPPMLIMAEKEEAKAVLTLFLRNQGVRNAIAARVVNKADRFIDHLVARLHSVYKTRYLVGRELTTLEIRETLMPYLESLLKEHGDVLVDVVQHFPNLPDSPVKEKVKPEMSLPEQFPLDPVLDTLKSKAVSRVTETGPTGELRPQTRYLVELGMDLEKIKAITRKFPAFAYYTLEGKIKPIVEFLLGIGVPESEIPIILGKRPQLCGISISDNILPTMKLLESLGVDQKQWAKVIYRTPALLTYSRQKLNTTVDFLHETGVPPENVGKILTRYPNIISYSVEDKLKPTVQYFRSIGVDVAHLLYRSPQTFGLSVESNIKPVTDFFLEKGFTLVELRTMISRFGIFYTFSLTENLIPKWEFFLTMGYDKSDIVKFPQYFGYSLEGRIKPRYGLVVENGVQLLLNQVLSLSDENFHAAVQRKLKKMS